MTTKHTPRKELLRQAYAVADKLRLEEGKLLPGHKPTIKFGIFMDDKILTIDIAWSTIRSITRDALAEYIVAQMAEDKPN